MATVNRIVAMVDARRISAATAYVALATLRARGAIGRDDYRSGRAAVALANREDG